ncbi:MAG: ARMT1-like domain-containing protein [Lachnospiraceae bacterium]|nr:ARMT1-like domain-containing protein [Lachnospiraceae bacterium]
MKADKECFECCRNKVAALLEEHKTSRMVQEMVMRQVELILNEAEKTEKSAPDMMAEVLAVAEKEIEISDSYAEPKRKYNQLLLGWEEAIKKEILEEEDEFLAGIQCAITGNYIDFGAMSDVNEEKLVELLKNRKMIQLDQIELGHLRDELGCAKRMVYITDNAGEIVLDKIFIQILKKLYPKLEIVVLVRGKPVLNDATLEDAILAGLDGLVTLVSNGTAVPGTPIDRISAEASKWIRSADLCIAKGQGNFETLRGCGENIYYLFLCKCELFVKKFQVERFTAVLSNEKRIVQYA